MKKKSRVLLIVICVLWTVVVCLVGGFYCMQELEVRYYTPDNKFCSAVNVTYVTETVRTRGYLYRVISGGVITDVVTTDAIEKNTVYGAIEYESVPPTGSAVSGDRGGLYAVLITPRTVDDKDIKAYRIVHYNNSLAYLGQSGLFTFEEDGILTGFSLDDDGFYLTTVDDEGKKAFIYAFDRSEWEPVTQTLLEGAAESDDTPEDGTEKVLGFACDRLVECKEGRFMSQALYRDGEIYMALDDGTDYDKFLPTDAQMQSIEDRYMTLSQCALLVKDIIVRSAVVLLLGLVVIVFAAIALRGRNRIVYMTVTLEFLIIVMVATGCFITFFYRGKEQRQSKEELSFFYMEGLLDEPGELSSLLNVGEGWYDSPEYESLQRHIYAVMKAEKTAGLLDDLCIVKRDTGTIVASATGKNLVSVGDMYTDNAMELVRDLGMTTRASGVVVSAGVRRPVYAVPVGGSLTSEYVLVGIGKIYEAPLFVDIIIWGVALFFIFSIVCTVYMIWQINDLRKFEDAMMELSAGGGDIERTDSYGKDMQDMWRSLHETDKNIKNINYARYKIFEAYYRFAPKNIEDILHKKFITDVQPGDSMEVTGNMAVVSLKGGRADSLPDMDSTNKLIGLVEDNRKKQNGILVSVDGRWSTLELLFAEQGDRAFNFGMDLMHYMKADGFEAVVFLYMSKFFYGVVGTSEQCFFGIYSQEKDELDKVAAWLGDMGLGLVITEEILEATEAPGRVRYIGYIEVSGHVEPVKLYEVLDACPDDVRRGKLKYLGVFDEALALFYQKDFYLSRSKFTEVLRGMPDDNIVKWYIFTCEKYLNETGGEDISFSLGRR